MYSVRTTTTIGEAAALLERHTITAAPVTDQTGEFVGMVSEGDLLWVAEVRFAADEPVG